MRNYSLKYLESPKSTYPNGENVLQEWKMKDSQNKKCCSIKFRGQEVLEDKK